MRVGRFIDRIVKMEVAVRLQPKALTADLEVDRRTTFGLHIISEIHEFVSLIALAVREKLAYFALRQSKADFARQGPVWFAPYFVKRPCLPTSVAA